MTRAGTALDALDGIAVTRGPGLIGSLVVGVAAAKALAFALDKPLYGVNHLHGHIFAPFLDRDDIPQYPFLALLVSGGHSQLVAVESPTALRIIGRTHDDAAGEAYDKTARLLGLAFPGGPAARRTRARRQSAAFAFPRHRPAPGTLDMSFSGLKTSVRYFLESEAREARRRKGRRRVVSSGRRRRADATASRRVRTPRPIRASCFPAASRPTRRCKRAARVERAPRRPRLHSAAEVLHRQRRDDRRRGRLTKATRSAPIR